MMIGGPEDEVLALEERRRAAGNSGDVDTLAEVLSDDFRQVHADGRIDDKAALLRFASTYHGSVQPRSPNITVSGDLAVLTGVVEHRPVVDGAVREINTFVTQVAARRDGVWRFTHAQATMLPTG